MSFGFSVGDIILAADLAWRLYKDCREAGERYSALESKLTALSKALASINSTLLHLADSEKAESDRKLIPVKEEHLKPILERCLKALRQLDEILIRYKGRMGQQGEKRYTWGVRRSSAPLRMMVEIPELHHELEICNASLCSLCEVVQLQSCSTISWTFEETQELLAAEGGKCCQEDGTHEISFRFRDTCFECGHTKCEYCGGVPSGTSEMNESQILGPKVGCEVEKKAVNIALADVGAGTVDISTFWLDSPPSEILGHAWLHSFPEVDVATGKPGNTLSQMTTCLPKLMTRGSFETIDQYVSPQLTDKLLTISSPRTTGPRVYCPTSTSTFARKDHLAQHVRHSHDKARRVTYFECPKHSIHNSLELHNRECPCMADADGYCKKFWNPDMISKLSGLRCLSCFDSESSLHRLMTKLIPRSPNILGALNLGAALGVGGDFLWLNKSMELNHQSEIMNWVDIHRIEIGEVLTMHNRSPQLEYAIFQLCYQRIWNERPMVSSSEASSSQLRYSQELPLLGQRTVHRLLQQNG
jgi:hypothetical protein